MKRKTALLLYTIIFIASLQSQTIERASGPIFDSLLEEGIIVAADGNYGFDFNDQEEIQEEEILPDANGNGMIDLPEALDFIIAHAGRTEVVKRVKQEVETNNAYGIVREKVKREYLPALVRKIELMEERDGVNRLKTVADLVKKEEELLKQMEKAEENLNSPQVKELNERLRETYTEMSRHGYHPFSDKNVYYLPNGRRIDAEHVEFYEENYIKTVTLQDVIEIPLPLKKQTDNGDAITAVEENEGGAEGEQSTEMKTVTQTQRADSEENRVRQIISAVQVGFYPDGALQWVSLAGPSAIYIPAIETVEIVVRLVFAPKGEITNFSKYRADNEIYFLRDSPTHDARHVYADAEGTEDGDTPSAPGNAGTEDGKDPVKIVLPDRARGRIVRLAEEQSTTLYYADLDAPVSITLPTGNTVDSDMVTFGKDKKVLMAHFVEGTVGPLPGNISVTGSGLISFTEEGKMKRLWVEPGTRLEFPNGNRVVIGKSEWPLFDNGRFYGGEMSVTVSDDGFFRLPNGLSVEPAGLSLYPSGDIHEVVFPSPSSNENPRRVRLPNGDQAYVERLRFYPASVGNGIKQAIINESRGPVSVVALPTGEKVVAAGWISFSENGAMTEIWIGKTNGEVELVLPDGTRVFPSRVLRFFNDGSLREVEFEQPEALEIPFPDQVRVVTVTKARFFQDGTYGRIELLEPIEVPINGVRLKAREYVKFSHDGQVCGLR